MNVRGRRRSDPIERYPRWLGWWSPRVARAELVAEARRRLYDAARRAERDGHDQRTAQRAAIRAFGPAWQVGLAAHRVHGKGPFTPLAAIMQALRHLIKTRSTQVGHRRRPRYRDLVAQRYPRLRAARFIM